MNLNSTIDAFVRKTIWIWLPFYAFFELIRAAGERLGKR